MVNTRNTASQENLTSPATLDSGTGSKSDTERLPQGQLGFPPIEHAPQDPPASRRRPAQPELDEVLSQ